MLRLYLLYQDIGLLLSDIFRPDIYKSRRVVYQRLQGAQEEAHDVGKLCELEW